MSRNTCHEQTTSKPIHAEVFQFNVVHKRNPAGTGADLQGIGMDLAISNVSQEPAWSTAGDEPGSWQQFLGLSPQPRQLRQSSQVILTLSNDILNVFAIQLTDHLCEGIESVNRVTPALTDCAMALPAAHTAPTLPVPRCKEEVVETQTSAKSSPLLCDSSSMKSVTINP